jgi:hypothetical protein
MKTSISPPSNIKKSRVGFHYFPDTLHYQESDLQTWLPILQSMNASWLVMQSETKRAIPEHFLAGLVQAGIEPMIRMNLSLASPPDPEELQPILESYARWGVHIVQFFDRPNDRSAWQSTHWVQQDLVERFTNQFMPFANLSVDIGLIPAFPALMPGGSYWDTAFLRSTLESFSRQAKSRLMDVMVLSAYAWTEGHSLSWGAGGPNKWPKSKPYFTPPDAEDHKGFRIYEWYQAAAETVLQKKCPIILLNAGCNKDPLEDKNTVHLSDAQMEITENLYNLINGEKVISPENPQNMLEPIPAEVISCNFWLLSAAKGSPYEKHAWFTDDGNPQPIIDRILSQPKQQVLSQEKSWQNTPINGSLLDQNKQHNDQTVRQIQHYLLLPAYEWGITDWHLEIIQPFVKKHKPTIGFSPEEAVLSEHVTIIGNPETFPDEFVNKLRGAGCVVDRISGDATSIANQLAER